MSRQKTFIGLSAVFLILILAQNQGAASVIGIPSAFAQATLADEVMTKMSFFIGMIITAMDVMMWVLFLFLNIVMDPSFIFDSPAGGVDGPLLAMLHNIWMLSRDLVNLGFALILIVGAVVTVVQAKTETVKQYLPKFVLAVVLVNFSWFIPRVVYDVSNIAAYTVYQLPQLLNTGPCMIPGDIPGAPPVECQVVTQVWFLTNQQQLVGIPAVSCPVNGLVCIQSVPMSLAGPAVSSQGKIINGLIVNYARLRTLASISDPRLGGGFAAAPAQQQIGMMITFLVKLMLVLAIHVALFFPMLALVVAFFIRIPVLWLTMAFMPFVALGYVIGDHLQEFNPVEKVWKLFLDAAFLPAKVGIPFAIGFILINAGSATAAPANIAALGGGLPLFAGVSTLWQMVWMLISLFVLWTGVFMVLESSKISAVKDFTGQIKGQGQALGQLAYRLPLSVPVIPGPGGSKLSPLQLSKIASPKALNAELGGSGRFPTNPFSGNKDLADKIGKAASTHNDIKITLEPRNMNDATGDNEAAGIAAAKKIKEALNSRNVLPAGTSNEKLADAIRIANGLDYQKAAKLKKRLDEADKQAVAPPPGGPPPAPAPPPPPAAPPTPAGGP